VPLKKSSGGSLLEKGVMSENTTGNLRIPSRIGTLYFTQVTPKSFQVTWHVSSSRFKCAWNNQQILLSCITIWREMSCLMELHVEPRDKENSRNKVIKACCIMTTDCAT